MKKQSFCHLDAIFDIEKMSFQNPYACAECKMAFSTPKVLHSHVQLTHLSVNIFPKTLSKNQPSTTNSGKTIDMTVGTENASNSENLLIKENKNSDGNIKILDKVAIQDLLKKQVLLPYLKTSGFGPPVHEKIHSCKYCKKTFTQQHSMKTHERIHSGEKPYSCKYCEKKFTQQHSVKTHERIHTGEKPYSCKYCEKKFSQQQSVKAHERIHTGEKPYPCNNCNYRATSRGNITKHELIHAKEKIAKQQNCKI